MVLISSGDAVSAGASELLRQLLTDEEPYRRRWQGFAQRRSADALPVGAVAKVIDAYLSDTGKSPKERQAVSRTLREGTRSSLRGRLSLQYLEWFIGAFEITAEHRDQLWSRFAQDQASTGGPPTDPATRATLAHRGYSTVSLEDYHVIGADRRPHSHRTVQVVRALEPLRSYSYRFDTSALVVDVLRGGRPSEVYLTEQSGVWATDIHLHDTLQPGETAVLEYRTVFGYPEQPPPVFRRGVTQTVGSVDLQVQFHPSQVPAKVWSARWEGWDEQPHDLLEQAIDEHHTVYWSGTQVQTMFGFTWQW